MRAPSHLWGNNPVYRTKSPEFATLLVPAARVTDEKQSTWTLSERPPMRKIRNPRYAPEFLERKLSPSMAVPPQAVLVGSMTTTDDPSYPPADPTDPGDPTTPTTPPTEPGRPGRPVLND